MKDSNGWRSRFCGETYELARPPCTSVCSTKHLAPPNPGLIQFYFRQSFLFPVVSYLEAGGRWHNLVHRRRHLCWLAGRSRTSGIMEQLVGMQPWLPRQPLVSLVLAPRHRGPVAPR